MITVHYSSVDGYHRDITCETIEGARAWAMHWVGQYPELGLYYAVSADGIGKITVGGSYTENFRKYQVYIRDLFPEDAEYVFTVHTLDSHEHFGPFGTYSAAWKYADDKGNTFQIQVQRINNVEEK